MYKSLFNIGATFYKVVVNFQNVELHRLAVHHQDFLQLMQSDTGLDLCARRRRIRICRITIGSWQPLIMYMVQMNTGRFFDYQKFQKKEKTTFAQQAPLAVIGPYTHSFGRSAAQLTGVLHLIFTILTEEYNDVKRAV